MTNEEAIYELETNVDYKTPAIKEACQIAIKALEQQEKTGHWIQQPRYDGDDQPDLVCPNCGFKISWWDMGNFCAKCGKGLEGGAG